MEKISEKRKLLADGGLSTVEKSFWRSITKDERIKRVLKICDPKVLGSASVFLAREGDWEKSAMSRNVSVLLDRVYFLAECQLYEALAEPNKQTRYIKQKLCIQFWEAVMRTLCGHLKMNVQGVSSEEPPSDLESDSESRVQTATCSSGGVKLPPGQIGGSEAKSEELPLASDTVSTDPLSLSEEERIESIEEAESVRIQTETLIEESEAHILKLSERVDKKGKPMVVLSRVGTEEEIRIATAEDVESEQLVLSLSDTGGYESTISLE
jgi:hypothetical protein